MGRPDRKTAYRGTFVEVWLLCALFEGSQVVMLAESVVQGAWRNSADASLRGRPVTIERVYVDTGDVVSSATDLIDLTTDMVDAATSTMVAEPTLRLVEDPQPLVMHEPSAACMYRSRRLLAKRMFDRSFGVLAIVLALPILVVVALAVRSTSRGPILFAQQRVGRGGRRFTIYKFRTMHRDAEAYLSAHPELFAEHRENDFKLPTAEDVRVTRLGRLLRATSLDELPQLINIIKGDMSFVGPRPVVPDELAAYGAYRLMYEAAYPGLTGAWQVNGRESVHYPARAELDADYVEGWRFWGDIAIILRTVPAVLAPERGA